MKLFADKRKGLELFRPRGSFCCLEVVKDFSIF